MIGILVGHNSQDQGAENYLGESEFIFNRKIALAVQSALNNLKISSAVIYRPAVDSYTAQCNHVAREARRLGVKFLISLHFNAGPKGAHGCEVLTSNTNDRLIVMYADLLTDLLEKNFGVKQRAADGVLPIPATHKGGGEIYKLQAIGIRSCIIEPCFASEKSIFENEALYVATLVDSIKKIWRKL